MSTVRDDTATTLTCPVCATVFDPAGRQRFCSTGYRQAAWRAKHAAPTEPTVARCDTVYACPTCDTRYLGQQRCDACNTWCRRIGAGALCPCCDEPIAISDLAPEQLLQKPLLKNAQQKEVKLSS